MSKQNRKVVLTFVVAGVGAVIADHFIAPKLKKGLKI